MYIELAYPEQQKTIDGSGKLTSATIQYLVFEAFDEADALSFAFENIDKNILLKNFNNFFIFLNISQNLPLYLYLYIERSQLKRCQKLPFVQTKKIL